MYFVPIYMSVQCSYLDIIHEVELLLTSLNKKCDYSLEY